MRTSIQQFVLRKQEHTLLGDAFVRFSNLLLDFGIDFLDLIGRRHDVSEFRQILVDLALGMAFGDDYDSLGISAWMQSYFFLALSISFLRSSSLSYLNFLGLVFLSPSILKT